MICPRCGSGPRTPFGSEIAIRVRGIKGLGKAAVLVFPEVRVCFHCGTTEFVVPEKERKVLLDERPLDGVAVVPE